jgi:hypothetical protein
MNRIALVAVAACVTFPQYAWAQDKRVSLDGLLAYGLDVVPPDVVDTSPDQDRIRGVLEGEFGVSYDIGPAVVRASAGARVFPSESEYDRYPLTIDARFDMPLSRDRRTQLRLRPSYEYVLSNDGRVFDRLRLDAQLIHRHNAVNTTTFRVRYGYRNQSERRFSGYDQSEWLGELRHFWRPGGGATRINASLLGLVADAEANRFSYNGYGTLLTARTPLSEELEAYGSIYLVHRDYKAPFSTLYPYNRKDTQLRLTAGLERRLNDRFSLFGETGYARNNSNVPTRRYDGFVGRVGVLLRQ